MRLVTLTKNEININKSPLRFACKPIISFENDFQLFIDDFILFFKGLERGVGLAAPQVGHNIRVAIINSERKNGEEPFVIVNPVITDYYGEETFYDEGCLSIPGFKGKVNRKNGIKVTYRDRNGKLINRDVEGFESRVFQHEIDHLNGILFTDRMRKEDSIYEV